jgi:hypothetical protein
MKPSIESLLNITEFELQRIIEELDIVEETVKEDLILIHLQNYKGNKMSQEEFVGKYSPKVVELRKAGLNSAKRELLRAKKYYESHIQKR